MSLCTGAVQQEGDWGSAEAAAIQRGSSGRLPEDSPAERLRAGDTEAKGQHS